MPTQNKMKVRQSIQTLQEEYEKGNKKPLEDLVRAWKGIKELPADHPHSFFTLAGYHGEPFQYRKAVDQLPPEDAYAYWGGYCNHGNVLFPTWHRVYVLKVEEALQGIVPEVTLPYWDESDLYTLKHGIPAALTQEKFELDGKQIDNPLRSFILPAALSDFLPGDQRVYEKPKGYETVRYPLSGLVGTPEAQHITALHNAKYPNWQENVGLLNKNVRAWLRGSPPTVTDPNPSTNGVYAKLQECLAAPNYTVFSNTTSAGQWNLINPGKVTPLESPHNSIHLAVGGFDFPGQGQYGQIAGANGDMGENNTAGMDPIFFFHHCNIDRMFWLWQKRHNMRDKLDIIQGFAGTSASDSQGPTPGFAPGQTLDMTTPLRPFKKADGSTYSSNDCVNIEKQLGFTYAPGSLDEDLAAPLAPALSARMASQKLHVSGVSRTSVQGSFVLSAYALVKGGDGKTVRHDLGHSAILSRYNVAKCANCLTHVDVMTFFPLDGLSQAERTQADYHVELHSRAGVVSLTPGQSMAPQSAFAAVMPAQPAKPVALRIID